VTIEELMIKKMIERGLWLEQAKIVMGEVKKVSDESMADRWDTAADGYPTTLLAVLWMDVCKQAVVWIDQNKPRHFARSFFV
jgi:hypothetical protein